jgi:hypothetical protein
MAILLLKFVHPEMLLTMKNKSKIKEFDAVKLMRKLRDKINKEIAGMTSEQIIEYFRKGSEQFEKEMADR